MSPAPTHRVPPGPPRRATLGLLRMLAKDRLALMSSAAELGDAVRVEIGPKALYIFNHPDHAKHVLADNAANYHKGIGLVHARRALGDGLLTSEGELWHQQRATIRPVFQHKRIAAQAGAVADEAADLVARLAAHHGRGPVDLLPEFTELTLGVLGRTLLDADLGAFDTIGHAFEAVQDQAMFEMVSMSLVPTWVPLPKQLRFRRARQELQHIVDQLLAERRRRGDVDEGEDLLARLIVSTRREADSAAARQRCRDELVTLLLAGHETTASTLGWTCHLVNRHPEVWQRLRAEAVEVLGDRRPQYSDLHELTYTTMVVQEAMRLRPPVWILPRIAQQPDEIGGYPIPAGSDVLVCPYTLHRHPKFWAEPEEFRPERFDPAQSADRPRYAYIPFGAGPRFCVGNNLGMMEAVFVIATLARDLQLSAVPGHQVTPEPMLSLRLGGGLPVRVHRVG